MNQKGFAHILLIVITLIGIAAAGYFALQFGRQTQNPELSSVVLPTPINTSDPIILPTPSTPNPNAQWITKSYSTYSISYPMDAKLNEEEGSIANIWFWGPTQLEGTELFDGYSVNIQSRELPGIDIVNYAQNKLDQDIANGIAELITPVTTTDINGLSGVTYKVLGMGGEYTYYFLQSDDNVMLVEISVVVQDPGNLGFEDITDQILSTFEFTK